MCAKVTSAKWYIILFHTRVYKLLDKLSSTLQVVVVCVVYKTLLRIYNGVYTSFFFAPPNIYFYKKCNKMLHSSVKCTFFHCFWLLGHYFLQKLGFFFIVHKYPSISWLDFFICSSVNWTWIQPLSLKIYRLLHIDNKKSNW